MKSRILVLAAVFFMLSGARAEVCIYYFWQYGCSACSTMESYLNSFEQTYPDLHIHKFELHEFSSWEVLYDIDSLYGKDFSVEQMYTPTIFIGDKMIVGANHEELEGYIVEMLDEGCACPGGDVCEPTTNSTNGNSTNGIIPATFPNVLDPIVLNSAIITGIIGLSILVYFYVIKK